ncbi:serine protease 56 [Gastrophryne carolinensis]
MQYTMQLLWWTVLATSCLVQHINCAPVSNDLYRMPSSTLQALSNKGTLLLEAALKSALQTLDMAVKEYRRRLLECSGCADCLLPECASTSAQCRGTCGETLAPVVNSTIPQGRIVGGSITSPGSWPWLVNIRLNGELMCGGVIIGDAWVLTAAHCFNGDINELQWTVVVGEYDVSKQEDGKKVIQVKRIITHPKFNQKTFNNDIALIELTSRVTVSSKVMPVCLPTVPVDPAPGTNCYIAGWGSLYEDGPPSDVVMEASVPVLSQETCRKTLGKGMLTNTMFCAGYLNGGVDSCQGDSGGPLTCQDSSSNQYYVYGITSWGDGCGEKGKPGVYTRVTSFIDWMRSQMKSPKPTREPTCSELGALTDSQLKSEISSICSFYKQTCPGPLSPEACTRLAQKRCQQKQKKCELRSYLQILFNLMRKAEDILGNNMDFALFTQTIPHLMGKMYSGVFSPRVRRDIQAEEHPEMEELNKKQHTENAASNQTDQGETSNGKYREVQMFESLFQDVGADVDDWVSVLQSMVPSVPANSLEKNLADKDTLELDEQLFLNTNDDEVQELEEQGWRVIHRLKSQLKSEGVLKDDPTILEDSAEMLDQGNLKSYRNQLQKRNIRSVTGEKKDAPGCKYAEEAMDVIESVKEKHKWILQVPESELSMKFQEILVDLRSKSNKGLCRARVRLCVAGKSTSFTSLVGLDNKSLYYTMPGLIALALDAFKSKEPLRNCET